ncbi:hypothetical protein pipiens_009739 [Culex pipiens pipiens]|uniref:Uncharacterized protein n=1 Tax=Culex pipiens pipiens TaxID=38569 RepID=A0ABD1DCS8_CULPP
MKTQRTAQRTIFKKGSHGECEDLKCPICPTITLESSPEEWSLVKDGSHYRITLKNGNEDLYAFDKAGYNPDSGQREVFTWIPGFGESQGRWEVKEAPGYSGIYYVRNLHFDEYLYTSCCENKALTRKGFGEPDGNSIKPMTLEMTTLNQQTTITTESSTKQQHLTNTQEPCASITTTTPTGIPPAAPSISSTNITTTVKSAAQATANSSVDAAKAAQIDGTNTNEAAIVGYDPDIDDPKMDDEASEIERQKILKRTISTSPASSGGEANQQMEEKGRGVSNAKNAKRGSGKRGRKKK